MKSLVFHALAVSILLCWSQLSSGDQSSGKAGDTEGADVRGPSHGETAGHLPNNFRDVETWDYPSGLRVHFKSMPQVSNVYMTAVLPVGSSYDPAGREGLAHFLEHMVFTDHRGQSEEQIKRAVLDRGGRKNGITTRYKTRYYVDLPASEWAFGVNWLYDLLTGHNFSADVVDAERQVVMLEKSRRQPHKVEALDRIQTWLRGNKLLVKKDFWEREFGLEREHRGVLGTYTSLDRIDTADLQHFYDQYYAPQNFTLMIVGNVDGAAVKSLVDRTFGTWQQKGEAVSPDQAASVSESASQRVTFSNVKNIDHRIRYKLYSPSQYDVEMAYFAARFLRHFLHQRLRTEYKATYGVSATVDTYAGHGVLGISGNYHKDEMASVEQVMTSVLRELKAGELDALQFENFRSRAVSDLYLGYQTATSIANWCNVDALCNKQMYQSFPDKISRWQNLSQDEFSVWLNENLQDSRKVVDITRPYPASMFVELFGALLAIFLVFYSLRRCWQKPVDMTEIRYVSNLRYPITLACVLLLFLALAVFLLVLVGFHGYERAMAAVTTVDSYVLQRLALFVMLALAASVLLAMPALVPSKLLLFARGWRLKFWSFRTLAYDYCDIREIRECSFTSLLFSRRVFTTIFLHWGLWRKGIYVRVGKRLGYFMRVRDNRELIAQFQHLGARKPFVARRNPALRELPRPSQTPVRSVRTAAD